MISQSELKYYSSLLVKKIRVKEKKFIVEGLKIVEEGLASDYNCEAVFATTAFGDSFPELIDKIKLKAPKIIQLKPKEFQRISDTRSPQGIAAVFNKSYPQKKLAERKDELIVLIDNVSDPGNLGTILRSCDWFGIKTVLISDQSVKYLNPKLLRASMGSIFHLDIYENVNTNELKDLKSNGYKVVCSDLNGKNIFKYQLNSNSIFTFSNESLGPSEIIKNMADDFVTIPRKGKAESLNVSSAAAIILANLTK